MAFDNALEKDARFLNMSMRGIDNLEVLKGLNQRKPEKLYLQENMIDKIENMYAFTTLIELNLSSNSIFTIENLDGLYNLRHLDLSNNCICKIENLDGLVNLRTLLLSNNHITTIERLDHLNELEILNLSNNEIRIMCNLGNLRKLAFLNLMGNMISTIPNLEQMNNLKWLNLSENRLHQIPVLDSKWGNLQKLYLNNNSIWSMNVLTCCNKSNLITLDLSSNCIEKLDNIDGCKNLRELQLTNNLINNWRELKHLKYLTKLASIHLRENPYLKSEHEQFMYPLRIGRVLPNIITIDGINVADDL